MTNDPFRPSTDDQRGEALLGVWRHFHGSAVPRSALKATMRHACLPDIASADIDRIGLGSDLPVTTAIPLEADPREAL